MQKSSKSPPEGQCAEQGQLPAMVAAEIMLQPSGHGEMMAPGEQHLQTNYGRVFSAGPATASSAQPRAGGGPGERHGSILNLLPGLLCLQLGASFWAGKHAGRAGSCPAPTGSRWLLLPHAWAWQAHNSGFAWLLGSLHPPACSGSRHEGPAQPSGAHRFLLERAAWDLGKGFSPL